jgi:hypothetical protein
LIVAMNPPPQTRPPPVFGSLHEVGAQRIAFDIAADGVAMLITLDGKSFETALVDMTGP